MKFETTFIETKDLKLDLENPRLYHQRAAGTAPENEQDLEKMISEDNQFNSLKKAIIKSGVMEPIWVQKVDDGKYLVIEGNRRTTCLRRILHEERTPPQGVSYESVRANIIDPSVTELEIKLQKARLQSGKKAWGAANDAAVIHEFHYDLMMDIEDIATEMQISKVKVKKYLKSYKMWLRYVKEIGDTSISRFAMFNEMPQPVMKWVEAGPRNLEDYHDWIKPTDGQARIRSAATRGGLRDFSKVVVDSEAINLLREDPTANVEDAFEVVKSNDILKDMSFLKRVLPMAKQLDDMDDSQRARLANEPRISVHLRSLRDACEVLLDDLHAIKNYQDNE
ncbi:MAG: ParB N-terminal domain-containing protein [Euryarchaeota archaeon]|nr:ParB N-terminal domain-containing protein [Euryarchaeota archaeon]